MTPERCSSIRYSITGRPCPHQQVLATQGARQLRAVQVGNLRRAADRLRADAPATLPGMQHHGFPRQAVGNLGSGQQMLARGQLRR